MQKKPKDFGLKYGSCDVVCYREREREINSPTLLCLNQNGRRMKVNSSQSMTCSLLNKEWNPGHSGIMTGSNGGRREKSNDWLLALLRQNDTFSLEEIWKRIFSLRTVVGG